jgi:flagellar basal body-associated protein FliL
MLIFSESSEEDIEKFKKGIVWISIGLMVMQISYSIVLVLFDR